MVASSVKATFTATDMFGETRMADRRASCSISSRCAPLKPVVPMTARAPVRATRRRCSRLASGTENSTRTRSGTIAAGAAAGGVRAAAAPPPPPQPADVAPDGAVPGRLERGGQPQIGRVLHAGDDAMAHAAGGAGDDDVGHRGPGVIREAVLLEHRAHSLAGGL